MNDSTLPYRQPPMGRGARTVKASQNVDDDTLMAQLQLALDESAALQSTRDTSGCCPHQINGHWLLTDAEGIAFWEAADTLIVADLHLEKGSSFARRGQLIPPYDTKTTLRRFDKMIEKWNPKRVIALGDSFHDTDASARLSPANQATISGFMKGRDWLWITGNHDPEPPVGLGGDVADELREAGLIFRHEPQVEDALGELAGHLHPKARLMRRGRNVRRSCFAASETRMILPSFGAYTGGLDVRHEAYAGLFEGRNFHALMRGNGQVYRIAGSELR
ncbi:ligase-associated DNA damage response endonuclease PdeM [Pseudahrensia aquimaris]|uniref:Ligase-associated DNA damage response endonuclease PdeM n=1 Tax=Pseudahrensia aquimaris TaxID=744461 RepID=A0ABW3FEV3_9HYPH